MHASLWTKILLDFMKTIVSAKFGKKLIMVESLDQLASIADIDLGVLPEPIKQ